MREVGDSNMKRRNRGRRTSGQWSDAVSEAWEREHLRKVVPAEHAQTTSESKSCLQRCGQEGCSRCNRKPTLTHVQLRLVMCTRHAVLCTRLVDVENYTVNTEMTCPHKPHLPKTMNFFSDTEHECRHVLASQFVISFDALFGMNFRVVIPRRDRTSGFRILSHSPLQLQ